MRGAQYPGSRMSNYSYPSVISSTQQILCLTPTMSPVPSRNSARLQYIKRPSLVSGENLLRTTPISRRKFVPGPSDKSPSPPHTARSLPFISQTNEQYKHTGKLTITAHSLLKPNSARSVSKPVSRTEHLQQFRAQLESYLGPKRKETSIVARKMAPVLRVVPAGAQLSARSRASVEKYKTPLEDSEEAMQKRVHFSDQLGLPLTRSMTPNYRRKHSYILRWLETAGRSVQPLAWLLQQVFH